MADEAQDLMEEVQCSTRLYTLKDNDGQMKYQYILKHATGTIEQYTWIENKLGNPPSVINAPTPSPDRKLANQNNQQLTSFTQPNNGDEEVNGEEEKEEWKMQLCQQQ